MIKRMFRMIITMAVLIFLLTGCGGPGGQFPNMELVHEDISKIVVPDEVLVAGLGEASHGVKEYQDMKAEVFKALVKNNGCRTFIIEGDFGNALKVDSYIHGGEGTAQEAAAQIGFRIYRTKEMEELLSWMRDYNETAPEGEDLHFYGMDMQQADSSKEYLFGVLDRTAPQLGAEYREKLNFLNDDDMFNINGNSFQQGMAYAEKLIHEVDLLKETIESGFGRETFEFARECAGNLYKCCDIRKSDMEYNRVRDRYMAEKVEWFIERGGGSLLFINGHNGHIGRTNTAAYDCLGKLLADKLGKGYFAIGTDAKITSFNSQTDDGFEEQTAENENSMNVLVDKTVGDYYYIEFDSAGKDEKWSGIISEKQSVTSLNVGGIMLFSAVEIVPEDTFDAMIIFDKVSPTTLRN